MSLPPLLSKAQQAVCLMVCCHPIKSRLEPTFILIPASMLASMFCVRFTEPQQTQAFHRTDMTEAHNPVSS